MKLQYLILQITLIIALTCFLNIPSVFSQPMSYQAVVRNSSNQLVKDSDVGIRISILAGSATGNSVYTQTQTTSTNAYGQIIIQVGGDGNWETINWNNGNYFFKTEIDPVGGSNYTIIGTSQILSVPYAIYAKEANELSGTITSAQISDLDYAIRNNTSVLASTQKNSYPEADAAKLASITGTNTGDQDISAMIHPNRSALDAVSGINTGDMDLSTKVDTVTGKGLSSNDYTDYEKTKLAGIEPGAEVNVNPDWNATSGDAQILNRPASGVNVGDMQYWGGNSWVILPVGSAGQVLSMVDSVTPAWKTLVASEILLPPTVKIMAATNFQSYTATLNGIVNPHGLKPFVAFEWGLDTFYSNPPLVMNYSYTSHSYTYPVTGVLNNLLPLTSYHYRIKASNAVDTAYSSDTSFITPVFVPIITTTSVSSVLALSAITGGNISNNGGSAITSSGVCYSTSSNPTILDSLVIGQTYSGVFSSDISGLSPGTTYYVRAFATNEAGTAYGNEITFTAKSGIISLTTTNVTSILGLSAVSGGNITDNGGSTVTESGICYGTSSNPTIANSLVSSQTDSGAYISNITGLSMGTTYFVRAFASNAIGTSYGNEYSFTTIAMPTIITTAVSEIKTTSAKSGGTSVTSGGGTVSAHGICWSTSASPTISGTYVDYGSGTGNFTSTITGLTQDSTYHVRAFVTNEAGTSYGDELIFTAALGIGESYEGGIVAYILQPGDPGYLAGETQGLIASEYDQSSGIKWYNISSGITGAMSTGIGAGYLNTSTIISFEGIGSNYAASVCAALDLNGYNDWYLPSKDELGKVYLSKSLIGGFDNASFYWTSSESNATDAILVSFSNGSSLAYSKGSVIARVRAVRTFSALPLINSDSIYSITSTQAVYAASIESEGTSIVTARGVCWSSSANPTIADNITNDGSGTGSFSGILTGLTLGTSYHLRSYATNSTGTSYGNELIFTTALSPAVGDSYQGGIVAYILQDGDPGYVSGETHGLIAAESDQGTNSIWYNGTYSTTGATGTSIGTGITNTTVIISNQGNTGSYAAKICRDYTGGGYTDWYLPSIDELAKLYLNRVAIGGFTNNVYWSSTEVDNLNAWALMYFDGSQHSYGKDFSRYIRAVRSF